MILIGTVAQYALQFSSTNGYLFIDDNGVAGADAVLTLTGLNNTQIAFGDIVV